MVGAVVVRNVSQQLCRARSCRESPTGAGWFSGRAVMPATDGPCWADLPRDAVCDPACSPQQRAGDLLPRGCAAPRATTRSPHAILRMRCGLTVRVGRPGALDRHKAAMVAGLNTARRSTMSQIGSFTRSNDGTYTGTIKTLAIDAKARLVPSDPASTSDKAPDLRVIVSGVEIGAAWRRTSKDDRTYHSVKLDDPSFTAPIYANLFEGDDGEFALIWSR